MGACGGLVGVRANTRGGDCVSQEINAGDAMFGVGGGKFEVVLSKAFEEGVDAVDVGRGVGAEVYDVVEVGEYVV